MKDFEKAYNENPSLRDKTNDLANRIFDVWACEDAGDSPDSDVLKGIERSLDGISYTYCVDKRALRSKAEKIAMKIYDL